MIIMAIDPQVMYSGIAVKESKSSIFKTTLINTFKGIQCLVKDVQLQYSNEDKMLVLMEYSSFPKSRYVLSAFSFELGYMTAVVKLLSNMPSTIEYIKPSVWLKYLGAGKLGKKEMNSLVVSLVDRKNIKPFYKRGNNSLSEHEIDAIGMIKAYELSDEKLSGVLIRNKNVRF